MNAKKIFQLLSLILCTVAFAFVTACEGPMGPAGTNGTDGTDGLAGINGVDANETCKICHNESTDGLNAKRQQFNEGAHSNGTYWDHDAALAPWYGECSACHNNEGFLARIDYTSLDPIYTFVGAETQISCYTCHGIHQAYDEDDWGLNITSVVTQTLLGDKSPLVDQIALRDIGKSNLCVQCHQSRDQGNVPSPTSTDVVSTSTHWGPHYGVQGSVLNAIAGIHIGTGYPAQGAGAHGGMDNACITCHMYETNHSLAINFNTCATTGCHGTASDAEDKKDALHTQIKGLMFEIGAELTNQGVMVEVLDEASVLTGYAPAGGDVTADQARALWNYMVAYQDHSYGTHNPAYMKKLMGNTKADLGL